MSDTGNLRLILVRAIDDEASFSPGYQRELPQFYSLARADNSDIRAATFTKKCADGGDGISGEFIIPFAFTSSSNLFQAVGAWLKGRAGRKLRLNMGGTETEADTPGELIALFNLMTAVSDGLTTLATHPS